MRRVIEVSSPAALSIKHRQLIISREGLDDARVPAEDISVLIVDHPSARYTHNVFAVLADEGAAVVICDRGHRPIGTFLPFAANSVVTERQRLQLAAKKPLQNRLWKSVIQAKIRQQGMVLDHLTLSDEGLGALSRRVKSGDNQNLEAQAAQRYWPALLGPDFRRRRDGAPPNAQLNYGYAILRAAMARALAGAGFLPSVGIYHTRRDNPFCLADDLMEPYRPYIDLRIASGAPPEGWKEDLTREDKATILGALNDWVPIGGRHRPLSLAIHTTASSLLQSFSTGVDELILPNGLPRLDEEPSDDGWPEHEEDERIEDEPDPIRLADDVGSGTL